MYLFLLIFGTALFVAVAIYYARHPAASWFHPFTLYLALHGFLYTFRPWMAYFLEYRAIYLAFKFVPDAYAKNMALIVADLGLVVFMWASLRWGSVRMEFRGTKLREIERETLRAPFVITFLMLQPLFIYSIYLGWLNRASDLALSRLDTSTGVLTITNTNGYAFGAVNMAVFLLPLLVWLFRFRAWSLVIFAAYMLVLQGIGTRGPSIVSMLALSFFFLHEERRRWFNWRIVALLGVAAVVFNIVGADRGRAVRSLFTDDRSTVYTYGQDFKPLEGADSGNLEFLEYLVATVPRKTQTYEYFVDQLQLFTEPIPRALWKNKPVGQPIRLFSLFDYGFPIGMTRSIPGEGWTQLGLLGVVIWCGLWGAVIGLFYRVTVNGSQSIYRLTSYFMIMSLMLVCYRDGLALSVMRFSLFAMAPMGLWFLVAKIMGRQTYVDSLRRRRELEAFEANRRRAMAVYDPVLRAEIEAEERKRAQARREAAQAEAARKANEDRNSGFSLGI